MKLKKILKDIFSLPPGNVYYQTRPYSFKENLFYGTIMAIVILAIVLLIDSI